VCFSKICIRIQWYVVSSVFWKKLTFVPFHCLTLLVRCEEIGVHIIYLYLFLKSTYWEYILEKKLSTSEVGPILGLIAPVLCIRYFSAKYADFWGKNQDMWASESGGIQILVFQQVSNSTLYVNISGFVKRVTMGVTCWAETTYPFGGPVYFSDVRLDRCVIFCKWLFVLLSFFFWSLYCLWFDIRLMITSLVSSNRSYRLRNVYAIT
jgi:hypothetical protein